MREPPEGGADDDLRFDPDTLDEVVPDPGSLSGRIERLRSELSAPADDIAELLARGELVTLLRVSGALDDALAEAQRAVHRADMVGTAAQQHLARLRLATVQQWRGDFASANLGFTELMHAAAQFGPVVEAFTVQDAGRNAYAQHDWDGALELFARALAIRERLDLPEDQVEASRLALAAAERRRAAAGEEGGRR